MKRPVILLILMLTSCVLSAQDIHNILETRSYILEATNVSDSDGNMKSSSPSMSFISVDSSEIIVQWISTTNRPGTNGYGGFTQTGEIYRYEIQKKERKKGTSYIIKMRCITDNSRYTLTMTVSENGNAHATFRDDSTARNNTPSLNYVQPPSNTNLINSRMPYQISFQGKIVDPAKSRIIVGKVL